MKDFLQMSSGRRLLVCQQAGARLNLFAPSVEKDFWVCWTLSTLLNLPNVGSNLTFKGGTSLSKAWKLIDRFSEDIDLVINREALGFCGDASPAAAQSRKQKIKRLENLKAAAQNWVQEQVCTQLRAAVIRELVKSDEWELFPDPDDPDKQTLLFAYPTAFPNQSRYVRQVVKIELGARSDTEPSETVSIQPMIAEVFPGVLPNASFPVCCVRPERTFWEKALLLHEENCRPPDKYRFRPGMARHYYDLYRLIDAGIGERARVDTDLFQRIVAHRQVFFRYNWMNYENVSAGPLRILPSESTLPQWLNDYKNMQVEMLYGSPPAFNEIIQSIQAFETTFNETSR